MRQGAADGNQWIFNDITSRFAAFVELYEANPHPSAAQLQAFFGDNFADGDAEIRKGFAAYVSAMAEDDPAQRQALMFQGNVSIATHEQAGVQPFLEEVGSLVPDRLEPRYMDVRIGDRVVEVDKQLPNFGAPNLVQDMQILDLDPGPRSLKDFGLPGLSFTENPELQGPGVIHLPEIAGVQGFPTSMVEWHEHGGAVWRPSIGGGSLPIPSNPETAAGTAARSWANPDERMWSITKLFEQTHTYDRLWETGPLERSFEDLDWLSEAARPR